MRRGLTEAEASAMIVPGFVEPITKEPPPDSLLWQRRWDNRPYPSRGGVSARRPF